MTLAVEVDSLAQRFELALGADRIIADPTLAAPFGTDATHLSGLPALVIQPRSTAEVATAVRIAAERRVPLIPRGAGTNLSGGVIPSDGGGDVVLDMATTGVTFASGIGGAFVLLTLSILISFAFASLGGLLALRFGTGEAVQGIFPLLFVTLFLSSSSLPRNLIKATWFRDVATYNPISYLLEALRSLVITGWDGRALALGFGFASALLVISLGLSQAAMKTRLARR